MTAVVTGRWACVTAGEYDRSSDVVVVNDAVVEAVAATSGVSPERVRACIVPHEMSHATGGAAERDVDEQRARAAATAAAGLHVVDAIDEVLRAARHADRSGR